MKHVHIFALLNKYLELGVQYTSHINNILRIYTFFIAYFHVYKQIKKR